MKKLIITIIIIIIAVVIGAIVINYNKNNEQLNNSQNLENANTDASNDQITKDIAYEGVNNYCKSNYNVNGSTKESSGTYIQMGDETETEYKVIFRSYTGAFIYFYVAKLNGITKMVEYVPNLNIEREIGTINIFDYLNR